MTGPTLHFTQLGRQVRSRAGETVFQSARRNGVRIVGACGGRGTCGTCVVRVADGKKWERACQLTPQGDCSVEVAPRSLAPIARAEVGAGDGERRLAFDPAVVSRETVVPAATLADNLSDAERVLRALDLPNARFDLASLRALPARLRSQNGSLRVRLRGDEIMGVAAPGCRGLGLAVDLGTTNAAGFLLDLETGTRIAALGIENPQAAWGADVISRIDQAARDDAVAAELRDAAVTAVNALAHDLCRAVGASV
jgi:uncharacterized 2Fe-2S/4Fe-4S cluster protein (DUF4445 family)